MDTKDINSRLQVHRTDIPSLKVEYLIYTEDCKEIEQFLLKKFRKNLLPYGNHEWIYFLPLEKILDSVTKYLELFETEYTEEKETDKYNEVIEELVKYLKEYFLEGEEKKEEKEEKSVIKTIKRKIKSPSRRDKTRVCNDCKKEYPRTTEYFGKHGIGLKKVCLKCDPPSVKKRVKKKRTKKCKCGKMIYQRSAMCENCRSISKRKVVRPSYEQLMKDIEESNYLQVGKKYGVSDNAVRKWVRQYKKEEEEK